MDAIRTGQVHEAIVYGKRRTLVVVCKSHHGETYWLCEDQHTGEQIVVSERDLRTKPTGDPPKAKSNP